MLKNVHLVGGLDIAELTFFAFFLFFLGLVWYLRGEDRREGYPLEDDVTGAQFDTNDPLIFKPAKTFLLPHGHGTVTTPTASARDPMPENVVPAFRPYPGTPFEPASDPLNSGVGPASYVQRADRPDVDMWNKPRIVPSRIDGHMQVVPQDVDPRGLPVFGLGGKQAGTVAELWVDRSEHVLRYLEVEVGDGSQNVLLPMTMVRVSRRGVTTDAITATQIAGIPRTKSMDQITLLEEDKVQAYVGAGYLWATPERSEPIL